jgi:hypothetical protein
MIVMSKSVRDASAEEDYPMVESGLVAPEDVTIRHRRLTYHYHGDYHPQCQDDIWSESCPIDQIITPVIFDEDPEDEEEAQDVDSYFRIEQEIRERMLQPLEFDYSHNARSFSKCKLWLHLLAFTILFSSLGSGIIRVTQFYRSDGRKCGVSLFTFPWKPTRVMHVVQLNHVTMNDEFVVGIRGETMLETHSILSGEIQVQYIDTRVQSMILTATGTLLFQQAPLLSLRVLDDNSIWRDAQEFPINASSIVDTNGEDTVIWSHRNITFYNRESQHIVATIQNVMALKLSLDGNVLFVATTEDLLCFRRDMSNWSVQNSVRFSSDPEFQGSENPLQMEIHTSSNGLLVGLWSSNGSILFYFFHQHGKIDRLLIDSKINATHVAISQQNGNVAIATPGGEVWILEKDKDKLIKIGKVSSWSVTLLTFHEEHLQVLDLETLTIYDFKCDTNVKEKV